MPYFATAGGPYMGKGFCCYRYRINEVPGNPEYTQTMKRNANKELDKTVIGHSSSSLLSIAREKQHTDSCVCLESPITRTMHSRDARGR